MIWKSSDKKSTELRRQYFLCFFMMLNSSKTLVPENWSRMSDQKATKYKTINWYRSARLCHATSHKALICYQNKVVLKTCYNAYLLFENYTFHFLFGSKRFFYLVLKGLSLKNLSRAKAVIYEIEVS